MADLSTHLNQLEILFTNALAQFGDGGDMSLGVFPLDLPEPLAGPLIVEGVSLPHDWLHGASWTGFFGTTTVPDGSGQSHTLLFVFGAITPFERGAGSAFQRLASAAGAACYRLPDGLAASGRTNASEMTWANTLYAYLKGTEYVVEGEGWSRIRCLFEASVRVLRLIRSRRAGEPVPVYSGSLRPGLPGSRATTRFECVRAMTPEELAEATSRDAHAEDDGRPAKGVHGGAPRGPRRKSRRPKKPTVPAKYKQAVKLWPAFVAHRKSVGKRATLGEFREWLKVNRTVQIGAEFDKWWKNTYTRTKRRTSRK
jgi:hypothetical protein